MQIRVIRNNYSLYKYNKKKIGSIGVPINGGKFMLIDHKGKTIEERQVRLAYKKLEQKLEKELKIKDKEIDRLNRKLNQRGGQIADMIALGLLPGGAKPPFRLDNRIDTLSWGPDGLHMSITRSNKLKLDFIEGNYTADSKTPGFTPSQRKFWQAAKNGNPIIHIWHHYNKGSEWKWKKIT